MFGFILKSTSIASSAYFNHKLYIFLSGTRLTPVQFQRGVLFQITQMAGFFV